MREHDDDDSTPMRKGQKGTTKGSVNADVLTYQGEPISPVGDDNDHVGGGEPLGRDKERLLASARTAERCGWCDRALAPGQPIWQWSEPLDRPEVVEIVDGREYHRPANAYSADRADEYFCVPFCADCADDFELQTMKTEPCVGCTRPVHITAKAGIAWLKRGKKAFCCEQCMDKPEIVPEEPGTRICAADGCGARFTPKRLDARYCSEACRQKTFRKSKKDSAA
jgi:hypothetical protein